MDAEFIPNRLDHGGLLSLALTDHLTGDKLYIINSDADREEADKIPFLREHVLPHIDAGTGDPVWAEMVESRALVQRFFEQQLYDGYQQTLYAWCGAQDMVRIHGLWNHNWSLMPRSIPHSFVDVDELIVAYGVNEDDLPAQNESTKHHALYDAYHDLQVVEYIMDRRTM
jgi:hypothetical protein